MNQLQIWNKLYKSNLVWKKETLSLPNLLKNKHVLELGAGTGKTLISILKQNPASITAIDFSKEAIKISSAQFKNKKIKFIQEDIISYIPKEKFDIIICYYFMNNFLKFQREHLAKKLPSNLNPKGTILFEDFAVGDFRQKQGEKTMEKNTIKKKNGIICHFFTKKEVCSLFNNFKKIKTREKTLHPIKSHPILKRKIISAIFTNPAKYLQNK